MGDRMLLRAAMFMSGINKGQLADLLGITKKTMTQRFKKWNWQLSECRKVKEVLHLDDLTTVNIFFADDVAKQ